MEKIVPFKKDIIFKTNLSEITSISLEHNLTKVSDHDITGNFIVSGEYKVADTSTSVEVFSYELPFNITLDEKYDLQKADIDIDDFYYEIVNDTVLSVNIDVLIQNLSEKIIEKSLDIISEEKEMRKMEIVEDFDSLMEEEIEDSSVQECQKKEFITQESNKIEDSKRCIEEEDSNLFDQVKEGETYQSYLVYIVRENDTVEKILEKYGKMKEDLEEYNDLSEIKIGDKIIIPS